MTRKHLFICDLVQRREIGLLHRNEKHQLTEASTGLADKLLVHNNIIKVIISNVFSVWTVQLFVVKNMGVWGQNIHSNAPFCLISFGFKKINHQTFADYKYLQFYSNPFLLDKLKWMKMSKNSFQSYLTWVFREKSFLLVFYRRFHVSTIDPDLPIWRLQIPKA